MGDRANVRIDGDCASVVFYTHWTGYQLPETVGAAIARKQRWDDMPYLARIIFCEMVKGHEGDETGFGISGEPLDNSYPILVVDTEAQTLRLESDDREGFGINAPQAEPLPFAEVSAETSWADLGVAPDDA